MKTDLISVIVPVYKVEKYLDACMESIVNQTYQNLEIILVDDGSPDQCPAMCDVWAKKDDRIVVVHQENKGLSEARNRGFSIAKGEYFAVVDSDDCIHSQMVELLHGLMKREGAKFAHANLRRIKEDEVITKEKLYRMDEVNYTTYNHEELVELFGKRLNWVMQSANIFIHRSIAQKISYPIGRYAEDLYVSFDIMMLVKKAVMVNEPLNYYRMSQNSIMRDVRNKKKMALDDLYADLHGMELLEQCGETREWYKEKKMRLLAVLADYLQKGKKWTGAENWNIFLKAYRRYYKSVKSGPLSKFSRKSRVGYAMVAVSPVFYHFAYEKYRAIKTFWKRG